MILKFDDQELTVSGPVEIVFDKALVGTRSVKNVAYQKGEVTQFEDITGQVYVRVSDEGLICDVYDEVGCILLGTWNMPLDGMIEDAICDRTEDKERSDES
jgi:hypothetical protein